MEEKTLLKILGVSLFLVGKILLITTIYRMSGFAISEVESNPNSFTAVFLIILGIGIFVLGIEKK